MKWRRFSVLSLILTGTLFLIGCGSGSSMRGGNIETGMVLQYNIPQNNPLTYDMGTKVTQSVDAMGQTFETDIDTDYQFRIVSTGNDGGSQQLQVTINSINLTVESPQGSMNPDVSNLSGQQFNMSLSPSGKEQLISDMNELAINLGEGQSQNLGTDFGSFFPDFSMESVMIGDTWSTVDSMNLSTGGADLDMVYQKQHTIEGREMMNGFDCIRVVSDVTGTMQGTGSQGGFNMDITGDIAGTDTWYFAFQEGILVQSTSDYSTDAEISVQGMSMPMTSKTLAETSLVQ